MGKDDMIRQILRGVESDCFTCDLTELQQELTSERARLSEKNYSEVEELYYQNVSAAWSD